MLNDRAQAGSCAVRAAKDVPRVSLARHAVASRMVTGAWKPSVVTSCRLFGCLRVEADAFRTYLFCAVTYS